MASNPIEISSNVPFMPTEQHRFRIGKNDKPDVDESMRKHRLTATRQDYAAALATVYVGTEEDEESEVPNIATMTIQGVMFFACTRSARTVVLETRKFVARCGTKWILELTYKNKIKTLLPEYRCNTINCPACIDQLRIIKKLLAQSTKDV